MVGQHLVQKVSESTNLRLLVPQGSGLYHMWTVRGAYVSVTREKDRRKTHERDWHDLMNGGTVSTHP